MILTDPVTELAGVGPALAAKFATINVRTLAELIDYLPRRYEDYSRVSAVNALRPGTVSVRAVIKEATGRYVRRGMHITEAVASDESGSVRLVWFNQPYRAAALKKNETYYISGQFELSRQRFAIMNPSVELESDFQLSTARIVPIYRETKQLNSRQIRAAIKQTLPLIAQLHETLPQWLVHERKLLSRAEAVRAMHFPDDAQALEAAQRRIGFEEVFELTLAALMNKYELQQVTAPPVPFDETVARQFVGELPFKLTDAQRRVIWQIYLDMQRMNPMNRLVEGDVGAGKTVVAAMAALMVLQHGHQVALMAPTELLARQHAQTLNDLLTPLGLQDQLGLLVGSMTTTQKSRIRAAAKRGDARFLVGTHALIQDSVDLRSLELIIIDEQHRFGVEQRKALIKKAGHMPHVLNLTATPIPRTLALTLYGELDVSLLDTKPPGRVPIITRIVSPNSRAQLNAEIDKELAAGRQMFVVCPIISDSMSLQVASAESVYERMRTKEFKHHRVGLLHGKLKADEKQAVMKQFVDHELDILVATTVIEVGVDVPNATIMLIEAAERFGLAQIHQLRGRVGRGTDQGYCYLVMSDSKAPGRRLQALERSSDGFRLAELDLELRGPGAIYGTMQHGVLDLRVAKLTDVKLIAEARASAQSFIDRHEDLLQYPQLMTRVRQLRAVTNLN